VTITRFVVDAGVVIHLVTESIAVSPEHDLLAPTLLRSQTLPALHEAVARGAITADEGLERHRLISKLPIRHLGDGVLRRKAWQVADQLGWTSTFTAEYVALTLLQADAFVTLDADLARSHDGIVATERIDVLSRVVTPSIAHKWRFPWLTS